MLLRWILLFFIVISSAWSEPALHWPKNFAQAKRTASKLYKDHQITFYCHCTYHNNKIDWKSCGYKPRKNAKRAHRTEWEHITPAYAFGKSRACWTQPICEDSRHRHFKGRRCCAKIDATFRAMESDLHNLVPAVGEVNGDRKNFAFASLHHDTTQYGDCPIYVDFTHQKVQPPTYTRGFIGRVYLYMHRRYAMPLTTEELHLFQDWSKQYPPTAWEIERNARIDALQPAYMSAQGTLSPINNASAKVPPPNTTRTESLWVQLLNFLHDLFL